MPDPRPGRPREGFATANHLLPRGGRRYRLSTVGPTEVVRTAGGQRLATDRPPTGGIDTFHVVGSATMRASMQLEAVQAQAGHRSIESTRIYLHLTDAWLAAEYRKAAALIDADHAELITAQEARA